MRSPAIAAIVLLGASLLGVPAGTAHATPDGAPSASEPATASATAPAAAPASCVTRTFTRKVKYQGKAKVTVKHSATGCVDAGTGCTYLSSYSLAASTRVTPVRGARVLRKWKPIGPQGQTYVGCDDDAVELLVTDRAYGGRVALTVGRKTLRADPAVLVRVDAEAPTVVVFTSLGSWRFAR